MKTTKKILVAMLAIVTIGVTSVSAQEFKKGDNLLNLGIGLGGGFGTPLGASFEHGFTDQISAGVMATFSSTDLGAYKYTYIIAGARASYHFNFGVAKLDPYLGGMLGYNVASVDNSSVPAGGGIAYGGHVGARYYFSSKIGAFAEAGYGVANLTAGLAFKF